MKTSFTKPYSSPEQIVQILKSKGMSMEDEHKVKNYLMNIGYHRLCIIRYFLTSVSPNNNFKERFSEPLADNPSVDIVAMGFNRNWQEECLWK